MKTLKFLLLIGIIHLFTEGGIAQEAEKESSSMLITNSSQLPNWIGELITIRGEVSNTKIPQIIGVDISSDSPDLRGKNAEATGVLEFWEVKASEVDKYSANRGAGAFYRLTDPVSGETVQVKAVK